MSAPASAAVDARDEHHEPRETVRRSLQTNFDDEEGNRNSSGENRAGEVEKQAIPANSGVPNGEEPDDVPPTLVVPDPTHEGGEIAGTTTATEPKLTPAQRVQAAIRANENRKATSGDALRAALLALGSPGEMNSDQLTRELLNIYTQLHDAAAPAPSHNPEKEPAGDSVNQVPTKAAPKQLPLPTPSAPAETSPPEPEPTPAPPPEPSPPEPSPPPAPPRELGPTPAPPSTSFGAETVPSAPAPHPSPNASTVVALPGTTAVPTATPPVATTPAPGTTGAVDDGVSNQLDVLRWGNYLRKPFSS